jgi:protein-S-isoprenylcysteine O-methyltransferase Ste14
VKLFVKNLLFTILVPGTVAVYVPLLITPDRSFTNNAFLLVVGFLLLGMGTGIYIWTVWDFASFGRGTPLPLDAPKRLVVRGLYCFIRNPMYSGVILVILGWAGIFTSRWLLVYAVGVWIAVNLFIVYYEEPKLAKLFRGEYEAYCQSVGRWVPRIPSRSNGWEK